MYGKIFGLGVVAAASPQFQAAALVLVVFLAKALAKNDTTVSGDLGPFHFETTASTLTALAAISIVIAAILDTALTWVRSKIVTGWDFEHREQVINEYLDADYATQAAERL